MHVLNNKPFTVEVIKPKSLQGKLKVFSTCALTDIEIELFNKVLKCVDNHLVIDKVDLSMLYTLNVFFIEEEITFSYEGNTGTCGNQFHLATYRMNKIRSYKSEVFTAVIFAEELTHYYWRILDEKIVKYKVVEILKDMYPQLTVEKLKAYGLKGL